jgi:transcription elongation factor
MKPASSPRAERTTTRWASCTTPAGATSTTGTVTRRASRPTRRSAAWDVSAGLLIDRGGNDSYQADGLAQGAASMQAIGILADLGGTDRYSARSGAVQGRSGGNNYHYHETGAFSFSVLLDLGGADDWYSADRSDGSTVSTGVLNEDHPQDSPIHGLFIDR